jgi:predicted DNA-binding transcriptional regulator
LYGYLVFFWRPLMVLQVTAFLAILGVLGILAWIGCTLATTPPPRPIEEIEKELQTEAKKAAGTAPASPPPAQK